MTQARRGQADSTAAPGALLADRAGRRTSPDQRARQQSHLSELVLDQLDPASCLKYLKAILSPHPYDLEPVEPVIEF